VVTLAGGQTLSNVVAVAPGLALEADGTLVTFAPGSPVAGVSNVVALSPLGQLYLVAANAGASAASASLSFTLAQIPARLPALIQSCNQNTIAELGMTGSGLDNAAAQLSGAKMLLADVLELGMPYTLASDAILHGFIYGSQALTDISVATNYLQTQNAQLQALPNTSSLALVQWDWLSFLGFESRLNQCLTNLQAAGQPEIPRVVGLTLRLLNLLQDACVAPANSPPPALEISSAGNAPSLLLYGEPYMDYTLQYRDSLNGPGWTTTTVTNLLDEQAISPPWAGGQQRFYRALLPVP
jgi:hypothetical protein